MYKVWCKLKAVREHLRQLTKFYSKPTHLRVKSDSLQTDLNTDPLNVQIFQDLANVQSEYDKWVAIEEKVLKQQ